MSYVSIVRVAVKPGAGFDVERGIEQVLALRRSWVERGDLIASRIVRADDGAEYALVSAWKDREAHQRHEDDPEEGKILAQFASSFAGPPQEFGGEVIAGVGNPKA